jgi:hypothetical protein
MATEKQILQHWLDSEFDFSHRIDVEPTPSYPIKPDELKSIFTKIIWDINKKHLGSRHFPKWKHEDKFSIVGCQQGGRNTSSKIHYHLLLFSPQGKSVKVFDDLIMAFCRLAGTSPYNRTRRRVFYPIKDQFYFADEDKDRKCMLQIERINNQTGSIKYNFRQLHHKLEETDEVDKLFFINF